MQLEVGQPEPPASLPAHAGLKGGLEVTKGSAKAEREWGVRRQKPGSERQSGPPRRRSLSGDGWLKGQAPCMPESQATCGGSVRDPRTAQPMPRRRRRAGRGGPAEGCARAGCAGSGAHSPGAWAKAWVGIGVGAACRPSPKPSSSRSARPRAAARRTPPCAMQLLAAPPLPWN